jgi:ectoine hydroxylase-related dioxygenase (phytanoyl-CoA dioxygenase family)
MTAAVLAAPKPIAERAAAHQDELRRQGWTLFPAIISAEQLDAARCAIDALVASGVARTSAQDHHAPNLVARAAVFREVAAHPLLLATIEGLIGDDCILSSCNLGTRRPGGDRQGLHRDTGIWGPSLPHLDIPVGIQTAWCIDDFTIANGATHLVPGSHVRPELTPEAPSIQAVAPAGSIIAFDARLLHAGGANHTERARRAVLTFYIRSWLKPQTDHRRSLPAGLIAEQSPTVLRLLGFQRQTPVEHADGRSEILMAPGATSFYGQPPSGQPAAAKY